MLLLWQQSTCLRCIPCLDLLHQFPLCQDDIAWWPYDSTFWPAVDLKVCPCPLSPSRDFPKGLNLRCKAGRVHDSSWEPDPSKLKSWLSTSLEIYPSWLFGSLGIWNRPSHPLLWKSAIKREAVVGSPSRHPCLELGLIIKTAARMGLLL